MEPQTNFDVSNFSNPPRSNIKLLIILFVLIVVAIFIWIKFTKEPAAEPLKDNQVASNVTPAGLPTDLPAMGEGAVVLENYIATSTSSIEAVRKVETSGSFSNIIIEYDKYFRKNNWVLDGSIINMEPDYVYFSSKKGSDHFSVMITNLKNGKVVIEATMNRLNRN